jgi:hypothetical protein
VIYASVIPYVKNETKTRDDRKGNEPLNGIITLIRLNLLQSLFNQHKNWIDEIPRFSQCSKSVPDINQLQRGKGQAISLV